MSRYQFNAVKYAIKILLVIFLSCNTITLKAQKDSITIIKSATKTAIGSPVDKTFSKEIGTEGGKIVSPDGRMEIIFPSGALQQKTTISLTPLNNTVPGGRGPSYKLEPAGIKFLKPGQVIFHYDERDYTGGMEELQCIAFQNEDGQWYKLTSVDVDTLAKTIVGKINHFSVWSNFNVSEIKPGRDLCSVGGQVSLSIIVNDPPPDPSSNGGSDDASLLTPPPQNPNSDADLLAAPQRKLYFIWSVNGVKGGSSESGRVNPIEGEELRTVTFTAPGSVPRRNPVEVAVEAKNATFSFNGKVYRKLKLVSNIKIFDHFHFTYTGIETIGHLLMRDSSSCDIKLTSDAVKVYNITNNPAWSDWPATIGRCHYEYPDKSNWKGLVDIAGVAGSSINVNEYTGTVSVHMQFTPTMGSTPTIIETCSGNAHHDPAKPIPAAPVMAYFQLGLRNDDVHIEYGNKQGYNEINAVSNGHGFIIRIKAY